MHFKPSFFYAAEPKHNTESYMVWEECKKTSKSVEVVYKNDVGEEILTKVNFKFDPDVSLRIIACLFLSA